MTRHGIEGMTLSELALAELRRSLGRPTRRELMARVAAREAHHWSRWTAISPGRPDMPP